MDEILRSETNFGEMDFATRDTYRHAIEDLSRGSGHKEIEVAEHVVHRIRRARTGPTGDGQPSRRPRIDPGYYLISKGRIAFERELGFRVPWKTRLLRLYMRSAAVGYLGTIALGTALLVALPLLHERKAGVAEWELVLLGLLAVCARLRSRHRAHQPISDRSGRPPHAAAVGVARRRDSTLANPCRCADPADKPARS